MAVIDADTHIIECEHTWDFMEGHDPKFRPRWLPNGWEIDGNFTLREDGDPTLSMPIKELGDPAGRLKRMDELGVDTHVILPGLFLTWMTDRPEVELALCSSYNRWLADACAGEPRFQWVMVPPVLKIENAIAELEYGAKNGACGVMLRGIEGDRQLSDPYFHPLHERARALDVPIVVHAANGNRRLCELRTTNPHFWVVGPVMGAFHSLIQHRIPATLPGLKFVFLESGAQWVPDAVRWQTRIGSLEGDPTEALAANNCYVAVRTDNDLSYVSQYGSRNLIFGTDFSHSDPNAEIDAFDSIRAMEGLPAGVIDGIVGENALEAFGLDKR